MATLSYFPEGNKGNEGGSVGHSSPITFRGVPFTSHFSPFTSHFSEVPEFLRIADNINASDLAAADAKGQH